MPVISISRDFSPTMLNIHDIIVNSQFHRLNKGSIKAKYLSNLNGILGTNISYIVQDTFNACTYRTEWDFMHVQKHYSVQTDVIPYIQHLLN